MYDVLPLSVSGKEKEIRSPPLTTSLHYIPSPIPWRFKTSDCIQGKVQRGQGEASSSEEAALGHLDSDGIKHTQALGPCTLHWQHHPAIIAPAEHSAARLTHTRGSVCPRAITQWTSKHAEREREIWASYLFWRHWRVHVGSRKQTGGRKPKRRREGMIRHYAINKQTGYW